MTQPSYEARNDPVKFEKFKKVFTQGFTTEQLREILSKPRTPNAWRDHPDNPFRRNTED